MRQFIIVLFFITAASVASARNPSVCNDLFLKTTTSVIRTNKPDFTYFSQDGRWMLSSTIADARQNWVMSNLQSLQEVRFTTEIPNRPDLTRNGSSIFHQIVSFETDNLKIYTLMTGHFKSFYQFNYSGEQIGSPAIKRSTTQKSETSITDSFFIIDPLRFYKHGDQLFVQTSAGVPLGRIPAPSVLSARSLIAKGDHLAVLAPSKLDLYRIHSSSLVNVKSLQLSDILASLAQNPNYARMVKAHEWNFDATISVGDSGTLLFKVTSRDGRNQIPLISKNETNEFEILGSPHPRFINRNFGILNRAGEIYTVEFLIQTQNQRQKYTTILSFYTADYILKKNIELDGYWLQLWSSSETVVVANDGKGLLQAWDADGVLTGVYKVPRAVSHAYVGSSTVFDLGKDSWLVSDSRTPNQYRIFDANLRMRQRIEGTLVASENSDVHGLFAIVAPQTVFAEKIPPFSGVVIYNRFGQQEAHFPYLNPFIQNIRFTSAVSFVAQNKNVADWIQVRWD